MSNRKVVVQVCDGWTSGPHEEQVLDPGATEFEFTTSEGREWIQATSCNDGPTFDVFVESTNSTGSRKEIVHLVPEEVV